MKPFISLCLMALATTSQVRAQTPQQMLPKQPFPAWTLTPFVRPEGVNPVIKPNATSLFADPVSGKTIKWEALHTFNPAAVVRNGKIYVLYRAEDDSGEMSIGGHTSRLGLAESEDGVNFTTHPTPVFYPDNDAQKESEWPGGCEDPRITEAENGTYVLTYTQWNRNRFRIGIATSKDLLTWTKHGQVFQKAFGGKYNTHYKSSGIVSRVAKGRLIAAKIGGKYWMYWGEGDIHLATSTDLINWTPVEESEGKLLTLMRARKGKFDSIFPEVGPPPILTKQGIVLLYNGKNARGANAAPNLGDDAYAAGQALFDAKDPTKLLDRLQEPFFKPELPFEMRGQYQGGTTFIEGLVYFKKKWFLYYGCADSLVGVAVCDKAAS
jgi:predicted GH43/DUF377 family glycosyl hydrolase